MDSSQFLWQWILAKLQLSSPMLAVATGGGVISDRFLRVYMNATHTTVSLTIHKCEFPTASM